MDELETYKNADGTYTSPRNNKIYKNIKSFRSHWYFAGKCGFGKINKTIVECQYCVKETNLANIKKHERSCYKNPENLRLCKVCETPIKNYRESKGTCSYACANTYFRTGVNNGAYKHGNNYRTECFIHHKKECIVCGEDIIVAVHHNDHDHENNDPKNLIPLCPTHHQYVQSRYKDLVQPIIDAYVEHFVGV